MYTQNGDESLMSNHYLNRWSTGIKRILAQALMLTSLYLVGSQAPVAISKAEPQTHTVYIKGFRFVPDTLTVNVGDTVVWINEDKVSHTATAEGKSFDSKNIPNGTSWRYLADKKGSYPYICIPHPMMRGKLIVQ